MTETELRDKVCATALRYLGCKEADGSHRPIIDLYNRIQPLPGGYRMRYTDPWCAAFVSAVGEECGLSAVLLPECSCDRMIARYQAAGRFEEADDAVPRPGDLIFYDWSDNGVGDCRGSADHVGLVVAVTGNLLKTVEGNMSDAVGQRSMHINSRFIRGFARPDYASQCGMMNSEFGIGGAAETSMAVAEPGPAKDRPEISAQAEASAAAPSTHNSEFRIPNSEFALPYLRRGDTGAAVRAAQLLLIGRGYRCGPWGADGDFGAATYGALYRFQRAKQLEIDGVIGPETWAALINSE